MTFGEWVKQQRGGRGLAEVARRAGMSPQQWQRIEKQSRHPRRSTVEAVARALEVAPEVAFAAAYPAPDGDEAAVRLGRRLAEVLETLEPGERTRVEEELVRDAGQYVRLIRPPEQKDD